MPRPEGNRMALNADVARGRGKVWLRRCASGLAALALSTAIPVSAGETSDEAVLWPTRLRADMARVAQVEWRLRDAASGLCPGVAADIGVVFDDRRAYRKADWPVLASTLGLADRPVVAALVPGGPAERAGLVVGDEIEAVGGFSVDAIAERRKAGPLVAEALLEEIATTSPERLIEITVRRQGTNLAVTILPKRHCAARLVLEVDRSIDAHSDARNVSISAGLVTLAQNDDELAMVAGHELAHIIHRDRRGGGISKRRRMEDAADSLGIGLIHCAGYNAAAGSVLLDRLRKRDWLGFLRAPTHRSFSKRVERLQAEIPGLTCPATPKPVVENQKGSPSAQSD